MPCRPFVLEDDCLSQGDLLVDRVGLNPWPFRRDLELTWRAIPRSWLRRPRYRCFDARQRWPVLAVMTLMR